MDGRRAGQAAARTRAGPGRVLFSGLILPVRTIHSTMQCRAMSCYMVVTSVTTLVNSGMRVGRARGASASAMHALSRAPCASAVHALSRAPYASPCQIAARRPPAGSAAMSSEAKLQSRGDWLKKRTETALGIGQDLDKNWPILAKIATVPGNENTFKKARHALQMLDRILDVFEPGQLGLSFNGGKDSVVLMLLLKEACDLHPHTQLHACTADLVPEPLARVSGDEEVRPAGCKGLFHLRGGAQGRSRRHVESPLYHAPHEQSRLFRLGRLLGVVHLHPLHAHRQSAQ